MLCGKVRSDDCSSQICLSQTINGASSGQLDITGIDIAQHTTEYGRNTALLLKNCRPDNCIGFKIRFAKTLLPGISSSRPTSCSLSCCRNSFLGAWSSSGLGGSQTETSFFFWAEPLFNPSLEVGHLNLGGIRSGVIPSTS